MISIIINALSSLTVYLKSHEVGSSEKDNQKVAEGMVGQQGRGLVTNWGIEQIRAHFGDYGASFLAVR